MRYISFAIFLFLISIISGCTFSNTKFTTEKQAIDNVALPFEQGAITLDLQTDTDLNSLNSIANSCTLLIIQAQHINDIKKILSDQFKLKEMFSGYDTQEGILKVDRYSAMPGQTITLHIDRSEKTRYVGIVAGYYPFPQNQHMVLVSIPVKTENTGWLQPDWHANLSQMALHIRLGSESITQLQGAKSEPINNLQLSETSAKGK